MPTSSRGFRAATFAFTFAAAGSLPAIAAHGQDTEQGESAVTISGNVAIVSDYRFRGVSLSGGDPAVQGGITLTHRSGFYAGGWASSIDDGGSDIYGDLELDLFAGWSGALSDAVGLDVGLLYYAYPSNAAGVEAEYFEPYATLSSTLGPVQAKLGVAYAWGQDSLGGRDNLYLFTRLSAGIPASPITLNAGLGYTKGALAPPLLAGSADSSGFDWTVGASASLLGNLTIGVAYTGVEGPPIEGFTDDALVGSVTLTF